MAPNQQQQPSIRSFFQPKQLPKYAAPPSRSQSQVQPPPPPPTQQPVVVAAPPPPAAPPLPQSSSPTATGGAPPTAVLPLTTPQFPPAPSPHPCATIVPITAAHIPALRRINALLLPVNYTESFYAAALDPSVSGLLSRVILWQDDSSPQQEPKVIGGIVCRIDPSPFSPGTGAFDPKLAGSVAPAGSHAVYIQSLGLLAPYRSQGIAAAAVEAVVRDAAVLTADPANSLNITALYAHVWTENEDGLRWYAARGFARDVVLGGYYFKLRPDTAWVVKRVIGGAAPEAVNGQGGYVPTPGMAVPQPLPIATSTTTAAVNLAGFSAPPTNTSTTTVPPPPLARAPSSSNNNPTPPISHSASPSPAPSSLSFQNKRPDMEWNDLPEDMVSRNSSRSNLLSPPLQPPPPSNGGGGSSTTGAAGGPPPSGSGASSRSSSTAPGRKKKERAYPAAAFGS